MDELIRLLKKAQGNRSLNAYARHADVSAGNLSRIMNGQKPSPEILRKLAAKAYNGITYEDLMVAAGYISSEDNKVGEARAENVTTEQRISDAISDDPELLEFWKELIKRDDLQLLFKQTKDLPPETIKRIIKYIKIVEDEEANE